MASVVISSRGGQHGSGADQTYYCFECDRRLTIIATSDAGIICPICGHLVLEEFETTSPPSPPPLPPPRITSLGDIVSFFPIYDTDSDDDLFDPLPPPLPPSSAWNFFNFQYSFDSEVRHLRPPSSPPLPPPPPQPPLIDQRPPCPQFSGPSAPIRIFLPPYERNYSSQTNRELEEQRLPLEDLLLTLPTEPSRSSDASELFYSPSRDPEEETPNQPPLPPSISNSWDFLFPGTTELQSNSPNHESLSDLQPPPPPPWWIMFPMEDLSDTKMTEELVLKWENHQCSICIDNFELNQMVRLTPCNHLYHTNCLLRWLNLHKSCPICRCRLSSR